MDSFIPIAVTVLGAGLAVCPREDLTPKSLPVILVAVAITGALVAIEWRLFINLLGWMIPAFAS